MSINPSEIHTMVNDRFQKMQLIGKGAFGHIFKAYDRTTKKEIAVKVVWRKIGSQNQKNVAASV